MIKKIMLLVLLAASMFAQQRPSGTVFKYGGGGGGGDDPSVIDPGSNLVVLDGDVGLSLPNWENQAGSDDMLFGAAGVSVGTAELNGHDIVKTTGGHVGNTTGGGTMTAPVYTVSTQAYSFYFVFRVVTGVNNKTLIDDGLTTVRYRCNALGYAFASGGFSIPRPQAINNGEWNIMVIKHDGTAGNPNAYYRLYSVVGDSKSEGKYGTSDWSGVTLGRATAFFGQLESDFAYYMSRTGYDNDVTENAIIDAFKLRFGL